MRDVHDSVTQLNWPYIAFVLVISACGLGFIAWSITSPAVGAAATGEPLPGGWSWLSVSTVDGLLLAAFAALLWKLYRDAHTQIDAQGISQPSLRGLRHLAWVDVRRLEIFGGVGWHLYGDRFRIVVSPYAYRDPRSVITAIESNVSRTAA